jgi:hypothetical protein
MNEPDAECAICGEPAVDVCTQCGQGYCVHHRGEPFMEGEGVPAACWNCSQSGNAKAALFWVALGAVGFVGMIVFFSLWS